MTAIALRPAAIRRPAPNRAMLAAVGALTALLAIALLRQLASGRALLPDTRSLWLAVHLTAVIPAVPLGGYVLWRRKGDRLHRLLGRLWAGLMLVTALSSFGLHGMTGRLSWIHLFSVVVLASVPRGVWLAMRGRIEGHERAMRRVYLGLVVAGFATFVPGRLLGFWLFG